MRSLMRFLLFSGAIVGLSSSGQADLVAGFNLGDPTSTAFAGTTVTTYPVAVTTDLADDASSPVVTEITAGGNALTTFTGSFSSNDAIDLMWFDFNAKASGVSQASWVATFSSGGSSIGANGTFSGSATVGQFFDLSTFNGVNTGSVELTITDGLLVDDGTFLPKSGFQGFASITGEATAVPEPTSWVALSIGGLGFLACRRRKRKT